MTHDPYQALLTERHYQLLRWGVPDEQGVYRERPHSVADYLLYMQHYMTLAVAIASTKSELTDKDEMVTALRKVVTLGVAALEQHGGLMEARPEAPVVNGHTKLTLPWDTETAVSYLRRREAE